MGTDDPNAQAYLGVYTMLAVLGTMLLLILQAVVSVAIIVYFKAKHPGEGGLWSTLLAPAAAFVAQAMLVYLLIVKLDTFGGVGAFGSKIPHIAAALLIAGFIWGVALRVSAPSVYARIGRLIYTED